MIKTKPKDKWDTSKMDALVQAFMALKNGSEAKRFLRDLLTEPELIEISNRWYAAKLLNNDVPYTEIAKKTQLSSTTIARVSQWLKQGMGGYRLMIKRLKK